MGTGPQGPSPLQGGGDPGEKVVVGVISDTHGLLRPEAVEALKGSALILHAGDIGEREILDRLEALAPVVAVRGNTDRGQLAHSLPDTQMVEVGGVFLYLLHDVETLDLVPEAAGVSMVIFGHSHQPEVRETRGVHFFNPGSAGPRRFSYPVTLGRLTVQGGLIEAEILDLL